MKSTSTHGIMAGTAITSATRTNQYTAAQMMCAAKPATIRRPVLSLEEIMRLSGAPEIDEMTAMERFPPR